MILPQKQAAKAAVDGRKAQGPGSSARGWAWGIRILSFIQEGVPKTQVGGSVDQLLAVSHPAARFPGFTAGLALCAGSSLLWSGSSPTSGSLL